MVRHQIFGQDFVVVKEIAKKGEKSLVNKCNNSFFIFYLNKNSITFKKPVYEKSKSSRGKLV